MRLEKLNTTPQDKLMPPQNQNQQTDECETPVETIMIGNVDALLNYLDSDDIKEKDWKEIFESQGSIHVPIR